MRPVASVDSSHLGGSRPSSFSVVLGALLVVAITMVFWLLVGLVFGAILIGAAVGFVLAVIWILIAFTRSDAIVTSVSRAFLAPEMGYERLHNLVEGLCVSVGLAKPEVLVIKDVAPNALVVGGGNKGNGAVVVTSGLVDLLDRIELEAVVAQLLMRIKDGNVTRATRLSILVGAPVLAADLFLRRRWWNSGRVSRVDDPPETPHPLTFLGSALLVLAPVAGRFMRVLGVHHTDTLADLAGCQLTRYPPGLVSALEKLAKECTTTHSASMVTAHLWFAEPLSGVGEAGRLSQLHNLYSSRSSIEERIALLKEI